MPNVLAMSFEGELAPSFDLRCLAPGGKLPDGWGLGFYAGGEPAAQVLKEPAPPRASIRSELVKAWEHLESSLFVLHIRRARWGQPSDANTQPFARSYGGRDWIFAHAGSLAGRFEPSEGTPFEPVGSTDTERVFCELLGRIASRGWKSLGDADPDTLHAWFDQLNAFGSLTTVLCDGHDLCVYSDREDVQAAHVAELHPPYGAVVLGDADLEVDLTKRGVKARQGVLVSSEPLAAHGALALEWKKLAPGELVLVRQGVLRARVVPKGARADAPPPRAALRRPERAEPRTYEVQHTTTYRYARQVERSAHLLRLFPVQDRLQTVLEGEVTLSVEGASIEFDDVFGNRMRKVSIETPFTELVIDARSKVLVRDEPISVVHARSAIPLVWMPWQRHMLQPYLLPPELPDSQLAELGEYAMSFVVRNDYDLLDTLLDLNSSIFAQYKYEQGTTGLQTTAFDVYAGRRGVCQDFTNLFICLARLLNVPARYVCGYVYTGEKNPNRAMSEASHAWVEVYLPEVGWRGFDPTNGTLVQTEHVRVAVGRSYVDATPTAGTIYVGGGGEQLLVSVSVTPA